MIVLGLVVLSSALFLILLDLTFGYEPISVGESLPLFDSSSVRPLSTTESAQPFLAGRRRLILVMTSSCPYCRQEAATLDSISPSFGNRIAFSAILLDSGLPGEFETLGLHNIPVFVGNAAQVKKRLRISSVPALFLVDEKDRVCFTRVGAASAAEDQRLLESFAQGSL